LVFQLIERRKFKVRFNLFSTREFRWVLWEKKVALDSMTGTRDFLRDPASYWIEFLWYLFDSKCCLMILQISCCVGYWSHPH
jgi:hypothetical protein